ncbi:TPA_asm: maturation protein [ssRNA phage Gerhypos.4_17]|uniref:Maturation protein n=2 Tax=Fiersviridae TaxID=2842319 RepID=A0A8S5L350_9VIRU|nr:maturation protein [ssRNA phage Gerhypos.4_17]QDH91526.1 MAG: hypothetical protein H4Bulk46476_000004 [Leviviridae sp.]DAD51586.1 TPA_asm: maturation protein [ssRNA phage Gerhypos.4_17]
MTTYDGPGWRISKESVKTPGYRALVRSGARLPMNPFSYERSTWAKVDGTFDGVRTPKASAFDGIVSLYGDASRVEEIPSVGLMLQRVGNRLDAKIRDQDLDLAVMLGEYKETAKFVVTAVNSVVNAVRLAKQRRVGEALQVLLRGRAPKGAYAKKLKERDFLEGDIRDIPKEMSSTWLGLQYGIIPLVRDVYAVVEKLSKTYDGFPKPFDVRTRIRESIDADISHAWHSEIFGDPLPDALSSATVVKGYIEASGGVRYWVDNPLLRVLDQTGILNPASVLWELTTLSFVVDWFLPVGDYLQSLVPPQGVTFASGWQAVKFDLQMSDMHYDSGLNYLGIYRSPSFDQTVSTTFYKERMPLSSFPQARVIIPDVSLSKAQITSGLSLLAQRILR